MGFIYLLQKDYEYGVGQDFYPTISLMPDWFGEKGYNSLILPILKQVTNRVYTVSRNVAEQPNLDFINRNLYSRIFVIPELNIVDIMKFSAEVENYVTLPVQDIISYTYMNLNVNRNKTLDEISHPFSLENAINGQTGKLHLSRQKNSKKKIVPYIMLDEPRSLCELEYEKTHPQVRRILNLNKVRTL